MLLQTLCITSLSSVNSNWSYIPEKPKLGQNLLWPLWPSHLTLDLLHVQAFVNGNNSWTWKKKTPESGNRVTGGRTEITHNYILSCNLLCGHVWNVLGRCLLCMDSWHFIDKTFSSIYFIKFPDLSLKYLSDSDILIERTKITSMEKGV